MRRVFVLLALLAAVIAGGATWYQTVEGFTALEALYQAVTTLTTVGFQEVRPLDTSGRVFTIVYILGGIGLLFYTATTVVETIVVGDMLEEFGIRRSLRKVRKMDGHFVICGYGRVGREVARELTERGEKYVVVDRDERAIRALAADVPGVRGDATEEATLRDAGVERARGLIAAADSDVGNTYIVLTARALSPRLFIVARAGSEAAERRLVSAGADRVISPYRIGGQRMAWSAVQPMLIDFMDALGRSRSAVGGEVLTEVIVREGDRGLGGRTIADAFPEGCGVQVMAREQEGAGFRVAPAQDALLEAGDRLVLYGEPEAVARFEASRAVMRASGDGAGPDRVDATTDGREAGR